MALLNTNYFKTLVAIGEVDKKKFVCKATGFLVGFMVKSSKDPQKRLYNIFLVTNRHVFNGKEQVWLRLNKKSGKSQIFTQPLFTPDGQSLWLAHKNSKVDLALLYVEPTVLEQHEIDYSWIGQELFGNYKDFQKIGIEVGDYLYILGFPMGISGDIQNYSCVKSGIISRLDKELMKQSNAFLIDSSIFPGNSGSPVILRPSNTSLKGTRAVSSIYLLGIVSGYIPYEEGLYSHQVDPPKLVSLSRENSGLSLVVPMDYALSVFRTYQRTKKRIARQKVNIQKTLQYNLANKN